MSSARTRRVRQSESGRAELWVWPGAAAAGALVLGLVLTEIEPATGTPLSGAVWPGDVAAASAMLQTIASASITTLTLAFTLTVVALQLASQQFSPRLLRDFMRDRVTKAALAILVAAFVFAATVQRRLHADEAVPTLAMLGAMLLALASLGALLGFIHHITRRLRVDTMMLTVHDEARDAIEAFYPRYGDDRPRCPDELDLRLELGAGISAHRSGFVRMVDVAGLVEVARRHDCIVQVEARPGDHVVRGTPLATVWQAGTGRTPGSPDDDLVEALVDDVRAAVRIGYERTIEQDSAFAFRQLTDIAVKALSPGINDPVTAGHAVGHTAELLTLLVGKRLGPTLHVDEDGAGRAVVPDRDLRYYLDLVCGQIRRYGDQEPTVLVALLRMLRDVGVHARDDHQRAEIERQVRLVLGEVPESLAEPERASIEDLARRVRLAMRGEVWEAYRDRSGETRSL